MTKFENNTWTIYNSSTSGLRNSLIGDIAIDDSGNKWIVAGGSGFVKFDGSTWTSFTDFNSGLPTASVSAIAVDDSGNIWIGTDQGLAIYNENGVVLTSVSKTGYDLPENFTLYQNYPNPFNPFTIIKFGLPKTEAVKIEVFNALGQRVAVLIDKTMPAGYNEVEFNAQHLPSGLYLYRLETGGFQYVRKMLFLK